MNIAPAIPPRTAWRALALSPYMCIAVIFLVASAYAFPQTDDFCTFARLHLNSGDNPFAEAWYMYRNWSGRYTANLAVPLVGWAAGVLPISAQWVYAGALMLFIAAFLWSCLCLTRLLSEQRDSNAALAWLMFGACLALMPSKLEGVLWVTGVAVYSIGLALLGLLFDSIDRDDTGNASGARRASRASLLLIVLAIGTNEFIGLIVGGYLALRVVASLRSRTRLAQEYLYLAVFSASFAVSVLAPGNFVRDATISLQRHNLGNAMRMTAESLGTFAQSHLAPQSPLLMTLLAAAVACGWVRKLPPSGSGRRLAAVIFCLIAGFPLHLLVYSYLTGEHTPGRVLNQAYALAIMGIVLAAGWTGAWIAARRPMLARRPALALIGVAGFLLLTATPMRDVTQSTRTYAPTWKAQQHAREQRLNAFTGQRQLSVELAPFAKESSTPPVFQGADIGKDTSYWVNRCVADYYRIGAVQVQ